MIRVTIIGIEKTWTKEFETKEEAVKEAGKYIEEYITYPKHVSYKIMFEVRG